jgi:hypothetical protein
VDFLKEESIRKKNTFSFSLGFSLWIPADFFRNPFSFSLGFPFRFSFVSI